MPLLPRSVSSRFARLSLSHLRCRSEAFSLLIAFLVASSFLAPAALANAQVDHRPAPRTNHRSAVPLISGVDGSQTGTANFFGNFTAISAPTGALSVFRRANCSLSLAEGTYAIHPTFAYTQTELVANYEQTLHSEAQLTTTPDVFAKGCAIQPVAGFGSQPGIFIGTTTTGVNVFAGLGLIYPAVVNGVYILSGTTTFTLSSFQDSPAGNLTAADLNKDGNGDLVITDSLAAVAHVGHPDRVRGGPVQDRWMDRPWPVGSGGQDSVDYECRCVYSVVIYSQIFARRQVQEMGIKPNI